MVTVWPMFDWTYSPAAFHRGVAMKIVVGVQGICESTVVVAASVFLIDPGQAPVHGIEAIIVAIVQERADRRRR